MNSQSLTRGLTFFSLGLGLAELLAPRQVAELIGVDEDNDTLLRFLGARELGSAVGLMQGNSALFLWSRVAGDAMDLGLLASALSSRKSKRNRVIAAIAAVAGVTALDIAAALLESRDPAKPEWRVDHPNRGGIQRDDPLGLRQYSDAAMAAHASGHLRDIERAAANNDYSSNGDSETAARESAAARQFGAGD